MGRSVTVSEEAAKSLMSAVAYLEETLTEPSAEGRLIDEFEARCSEIAAFPQMCPASDEPRLRSMGYRKALVFGYVLLYRASEDGDVIVTNLFHRKQDFGRLV